MPDTKISAATATTPPLSTDMLPFARSGDTVARMITVGSFLDNAPATTFANAHVFAAAVTFNGTVTIPALTIGSVLFAGTGGLLSQDNANLFWDDTNNRLGIGTVTPQVLLHAYAASGIASVRVQAATNSQASIDLYQALQSTRLVTDANYVFSIYDISVGSYRFVINTVNGNVGIGTAAPTAKLQVVGLVSYADNAAAVAAGLTVGAFYYTGDILKVVHA